MEESFGAQYALQIALHTLRERCHQFQQRIAVLEEENVTLRGNSECCDGTSNNSLCEVDTMKQQILQLTEQKNQLSNNMQMLSSENHRLWSRLSKITQANENLGLKLNKINNTLSQHSCTPNNSHSTLIRSRTFTQDEPHLKYVQKDVSDENGQISLELEDISLKLISTIAKEKSELELQCFQMAELQNNSAPFVNCSAFAYPVDELNNSILENLEEQLISLKNIKLTVSQEQGTLKKSISNLLKVKDINENRITTIVKSASVSVQTSESKCFDQPELRPLEWEVLDTNITEIKSNSSSQIVSNEGDKICPMCSKLFSSNCKFSDFQNHVESHFVVDSDTTTNNFEFIA